MVPVTVAEAGEHAVRQAKSVARTTAAVRRAVASHLAVETDMDVYFDMHSPLVCTKVF